MRAFELFAKGARLMIADDSKLPTDLEPIKGPKYLRMAFPRWEPADIELNGSLILHRP